MQEGNVMLYAGKESGPRREGVGFILDKEATKSIIGYNPMSPRVITIRLKAHPINLTIIQVYAPTSDASDDNLESFYNTVQEALDKTPPRDLLVMMGDWNAKVGKTERKNSHIGIHGLGEQNERGVKLAAFCISNDLTIGNTIFPHHPRRLYTWRSPGERTRNQIDYIMVKRRWRTSLLNVKTRPDADCGSDHQLLLATTKIKLQTTTKRENATRYDIQNIPEAFTVEIRNRFTPLLQYAEEECTPEELWTKTTSTMSEIVKKYIPKRKRQKKAWLKNTTMDIAEERRTAKSRGDLEGLARLNKEFRKAANEDKRDYLKERCQHLEQSNKNPKEVSKVIKEITGKWAPQTEVINDKDGNTLTESEAIMKRWAEHCHQLYQEPQNHQWTRSHEHEREPDITREEVQTALRALPNDKAPGIDETPIELWKSSGEEGVTLLWKLCDKIWRCKEWPKDWCRGIFMPIYKKGNVKECSNYRTINLMVHASKVLLKNPTEIFIRDQ